MRFGGFINTTIREMNGTDKPLGLCGKAERWIAVKRSNWICFGFQAVFFDCFHCKRAGDFAMGFAAHSIGKDKEVQRLHEPEAVFIVRPNAAYVGRAATEHTHKNSLGISGPRAHTMPDSPDLTLADPNRRRKEVRPTDYSRIDYMPVRIGYTVVPAGVAPAAAERKVNQTWR